MMTDTMGGVYSNGPGGNSSRYSKAVLSCRTVELKFGCHL
jgi:hypothetical protein